MASSPVARPKRWTTVAVFTVLLTTCTLDTGSRWRGGFDREAWIEDYLQLRSEVADSYANLEWSVATGRIDPYRLNIATLRALRNATSRHDAARALVGFVKAFDDPHFSLRPSDAEPIRGHWLSSDVSLPGPSKAPASACQVIGFLERPSAETDFVFSWGKRNFHALPARGSFPAGILTAGGRRFGVLRIGSFSDADYVDACVKTFPAFRKNHSGPCKGACRSKFQIAFHQSILEDLASRVSELSGAGVDAIIVDLTGNSGGYSWYLQAARLLTARMVLSRRDLFMKEEAATAGLRHELASIAHGRDSKETSMEARRWLDEAGSRMRALVRQTRRPCERFELFVRPDYKLPCSGLVSGEYYGDGPFSALPEEIQIPEDLKLELFDSYWGPIPEGSWTGPLLLLVDGDTASAAELFALVLREAGAAVIVGERTSGAGGGYAFGQGDVVLQRSRLRARIPNSVALFKDGRNAREGVEPDLCVDWSPTDSPWTRTRKLLRVLETM